MGNKKVGVIGVGNVGATLAFNLATKNICDEIVLKDLREDYLQAMAIDISQAANAANASTNVSGKKEDFVNCDVIVITAGIPRKPGMSRDDLISTNAKIVKSVVESIMKHNTNPIIIVVSNPLDVMCYTAYLSAKVDKSRVMGMAGVLDTARYRSFLALELNVSPKDIQALLMGGHGDTMVPLIRYSSVAGIPIPDLMEMGWISKTKVEEIVQRTRDGGAEIVKLLGNGSAYFAPAASAIKMAESYLFDKKKILPVAAHLDGQYGVKDYYIGVPAIIGGNGVEKIVEVKLNSQELTMFTRSFEAVKKLVSETGI